MNREQMMKALITILKKNQEEIGANDDEINEDTRPIGELTSFDSQTSVLVTVRCYEELKIKSDEKMISLFIGDKKGIPYALNVGQVADRILTLISKG